MDSESLAQIPVSITNPWVLGGPSDPVVLYEGVATLNHTEDPEQWATTVTWIPSRGIRAVLRSDEWRVEPGLDEADLTLDRREHCRVLLSRVSFPSASGSGCEIEAVSAENWIGYGSDRELSRLFFAVPNLPEYYGRAIRDGEHRFRRGRLVFETEGWVVHLDNLPDCKPRLEEIERFGGTTLTHIGEVFRKDGRSFLPDDAESVLSTLGWFLSFARGAWSQPVLLKGYDQAGKAQFWRGCNLRQTPYKGLLTWWPVLSAQDSEAWFPQFHQALNSSEYGEALKQALSLYIDANSSDLTEQSRIVLFQSGLEIMEMLQGGKASGPVAESLKKASVSQEIPPHLISLLKSREAGALGVHKSKGGAKQPVNGPGALYQLRNYAVHSAALDMKAKDHLAPHAYTEARRLAGHYLCLTLLHKTGYSGRYVDVTVSGGWQDQGIRVPWAGQVEAVAPEA